MNIKRLQRGWDELGKTDPFWAVLSHPDKKGNRWQLDEFFKTGAEEVDAIMGYIKSLDINIQSKKALDFGCGVGRLTQTLANYFDVVYGVDIAPSMIRLAKKYNKTDKCKYYLNFAENLRLFSDNSFDLILSNFTLQHIEPRYAKRYIIEFLRILAPKGLLIFQQPSEEVDKQRYLRLRKIGRWILSKIGQLNMEMHGIKKEELIKFLERNGAKIIEIKQDYRAGPAWTSFQYFITKKS